MIRQDSIRARWQPLAEHGLHDGTGVGSVRDAYGASANLQSYLFIHRQTMGQQAAPN